MRIVTTDRRSIMTTFIAAPTHHNGYDFVAVLVKDMVLTNVRLREEMIDAAYNTFGKDPVLIGERRHGTYGAQRAVSTLRNISIDRLPWQEYRLQ
jgi:hypothetical protein